MKTKYIILALALFIAPAATAQDYFAKRDLGGGSAMCKQASHCSHLAPSFAKLKYYFGDNSPIVKKQNTLKVHNTFTNPENGEKEGELTIYKFVLPKSDVSYTDSVRVLYEAISQAMDDGKIPRSGIYTLWSITGNKDRSYTGYRLYHNKSEFTLVGTESDNCYTVGLINEDDTQFRTTYTIEWSEMSDGGVTGRLITTYAPIKPQIESPTVTPPSEPKNDNKMWMRKLFFYLDKLKDGESLYLSGLYSLAKECDMLDHDDLQVAIGQIKLSKAEFERKHKDASSILLLQQVIEILEARLSK
ncbi:MAG: hypothetical protein J6N71_08230 [Muribaculaceae bacterium]|nr:hypothetical protein [Muribaculaceae bacterium]